MITIPIHCDPGHAWLEVQPAALSQIGNIRELFEQISNYSYRSEDGNTWYLEEDCDATTLIEWLTQHGYRPQDGAIEFKEIFTNEDSFIRDLPSIKE